MPAVMAGERGASSRMTEITPSAVPSRPRTARLTRVVITDTSRGSLNRRRLVVKRPSASAALIFGAARRGSLRSPAPGQLAGAPAAGALAAAPGWAGWAGRGQRPGAHQGAADDRAGRVDPSGPPEGDGVAVQGGLGRAGAGWAGRGRWRRSRWRWRWRRCVFSREVPIEPPSWLPVLTVAEATPVSRGGTPAVPVSAAGAKMNPRPAPISSTDGRMSAA